MPAGKSKGKSKSGTKGKKQQQQSDDQEPLWCIDPTVKPPYSYAVMIAQVCTSVCLCLCMRLCLCLFLSMIDRTIWAWTEKFACHAVPAVALLLLPSLVCTLTRTRTRQAIESRTDKKQTLAGIYQYITDTYPYFGTQDPTGWQNSIRHNLSLNKNFKRVPRGPNEPGKGAFWSIEPSVYDKIVKDLFKRKSRGPKTRSRPKKPPQK